MKTILDFFRKDRFLVILIIGMMLLRIPSLMEPNWYGDEGIYLVMGQAFRSGLTWYRDIHDNKPPLLYLLATLAGSVAYFRLILLFWMVVTMGVFAKLLAKLNVVGNSRNIALVLFTLLTTVPVIEGHIANAEIFMILPTLIGVILALQGGKRNNFLSGIFFGLAVLFKMPALFEFAGVFGFLFLLDKARWSRIPMIIGFILPIALSIAYYFLIGAGMEYLGAAFFQNIGYLSSWRTGSMTKSGISTQSGLMVRGIILVVLALWSLLVGKKQNMNYRVVVGWYFFALFGALLSERPYPHYLLQIVAPLTILVGMVSWKLRVRFGILLVALLLLISGIVKYKFYFYDTFGYYQKFITNVLQSENSSEWGEYFDRKVGRTKNLASYLRENTNKNEKILVWADEPFVFIQSETLPLTKYMVAYHIVDFQAKEMVIKQMESNPPRFVVWPTTEGRDFAELSAILDRDYAIAERFGDARVYLRTKQPSENK